MAGILLSITKNLIKILITLGVYFEKPHNVVDEYFTTTAKFVIVEL